MTTRRRRPVREPSAATTSARARSFDISAFALPGTPGGEIRFEEPRDICMLRVFFAGPIPDRVRVFYLRSVWPAARFELHPDADLVDPVTFGWSEADDHYNTSWQRASVTCRKSGDRCLVVRFRGLRRDPAGEAGADPPLSGDGAQEYDVTFRRTLGIRIEAPRRCEVRRVGVETMSPAVTTRVRVELDAGRRTRGAAVRLSAYNARISRLEPKVGTRASDGIVSLGAGRTRKFEFAVAHMAPEHRSTGDRGVVSFSLDHTTFSISMQSLDREGPIWFAEEGVYIASAQDDTDFATYRRRIREEQTTATRVMAEPEQSFGGALAGQPRPHVPAYTIGCNGARQVFWVEPDGDILIHALNVIDGGFLARYAREGAPAAFKNDQDGRFFFGLSRWPVLGRSCGPSPVNVWNMHRRRGGVVLQQQAFAVPLHPVGQEQLTRDDPVVALVRFELTNTSAHRERARLAVAYSSCSDRARNRMMNRSGKWPAAPTDADQIPDSPREDLIAEDGMIRGRYRSDWVTRCAYETTTEVITDGSTVCFDQELDPGETAVVVLKIPYLAPADDDEHRALATLDAQRCYQDHREYWVRQGDRGARIRTAEPRLDALHAAHLTHQMISDHVLGDDSGLVNTSVGASQYGNYANESCMIIQDLEQRGLHEEARRRLDLFVRYQGTAGMLGRFSDHDGVYFGAGGFEGNPAYCQNHGWVLGALAEHYLMTGDDAWLGNVADSMLRGVEWVRRQRELTRAQLPFSRGWEHGLLPAAGLEDVGEYQYWLSNNLFSWQGLDRVATAFETASHPEAARVRAEADSYRSDLTQAVARAREHAPLVRLGNGRWVPHFPCRLYLRGRDGRWISDVLEGAIYLILTGFFEPTSKEAGWILDDYLDNLYMEPPFGYPVRDRRVHWFDRGGFSIQPNLLATLLAYLERDEIEVYLWMFFNALASCYREETGALVEHPMPELGFDNAVPVKTSDEANVTMWLRYMFVYDSEDTLWVGRAIPRDWLRHGQVMGAQCVKTHYGRCRSSTGLSSKRGRSRWTSPSTSTTALDAPWRAFATRKDDRYGR